MAGGKQVLAKGKHASEATPVTSEKGQEVTGQSAVSPMDVEHPVEDDCSSSGSSNETVESLSEINRESTRAYEQYQSHVEAIACARAEQKEGQHGARNRLGRTARTRSQALG